MAAGTTIANTARAHFEIAGVAQDIASNTVSLIVAERLDATLAPERPDPVQLGAGTNAIPVLLTNTGNGDEAYTLTGMLPDSDGGATLRTIVVDADGDGRYDPAKDPAPVDATTVMLAPGATIRLFAIVDASTGSTAGDATGPLTLSASAATGSGTPGQTFAGTGENGGDAVVGPSGARATARIAFARDTTAPTLTKTQAVRAPDGSATPMHGAIVTYTLAARFPGATAAVRIDDPVPVGTTYVPASLKLGDGSLSDAADGDAGSFDGTTIHVAIGDVGAAATRIVQFQVQIQ